MPPSAAISPDTVSTLVLLPPILAPSVSMVAPLYHWYVRALPVAVTVKEAFPPSHSVTSAEIVANVGSPAVTIAALEITVSQMLVSSHV